MAQQRLTVGNRILLRRCGQLVDEAYPKIALGAGHFAFVAPCSEALARVAASLCGNPPGFDRVAFHRDFNRSVVGFFVAQLGGTP